MHTNLARRELGPATAQVRTTPNLVRCTLMTAKAVVAQTAATASLAKAPQRPPYMAPRERC